MPMGRPAAMDAPSASNCTTLLPGASQYSALSGTKRNSARPGDSGPSGNQGLAIGVHNCFARSASTRTSQRPEIDT